jgi:hypothetical protein
LIALVVVAIFFPALKASAADVSVFDTGLFFVDPNQVVPAGAFTIQNNDHAGTINVSHIEISLHDPFFFSTIAVSGTGTGTLSGTNAPQPRVTYGPITSLDFSPPLSLQPGQGANYALTATVADTPARISDPVIMYAGFLPFASGSLRSSVLLALIVAAAINLTLVLIRPTLQRRILLAFTLVLLLASTQTACGSMDDEDPGSVQTLTLAVATDDAGNSVTLTGAIPGVLSSIKQN